MKIRDLVPAAALALGRLADANDLPRLHQLADSYPEVSTRDILLEICARLESQTKGPAQAPGQENKKRNTLSAR